jgi:porin
MVMARRPWTGLHGWILAAGVLCAANPSPAQESKAPASQTQVQTTTESKGAATTHCHVCGVELTPAAFAFDAEGHPLCSKCAPKPPTPPPPAEPPKPAPPPAETKPFSLLTAKRLTGDWGGVRTKLEDAGIKFEPVLNSTAAFNFHGGKNTHNANDVAGLAFWNLELDFGKMGLLKGATFFVRATQSWNDGIGGDVGGLTAPYFAVASSGDQEIAIDKYWYRQRLFDDRLEFRLGKLATSSDLFDANDLAGSYVTQFSNKALFVNPILPGTKSLGAFVKVWPVDWLYVQGAAVDPDVDNDYNRRGTSGFETAFHGQDRFQAFWELGLVPKFKTAKGDLVGHYRFGGFYEPRPKQIFRNDWGGTRAKMWRNDDVGYYFNFDQLVWKERSDPKDKQGLGVFGRYGYAEPDVNKVEHFWSLGASYQGLVPARDTDVLAFGVAQSIMSHQYRVESAPTADYETVYELYYAIQVTPWCAITPDVQWIAQPGGNDDARDALVGGVRVKIAF